MALDNKVMIRIDNVLAPDTFDNFEAMMNIINANGAKITLAVTPKWHGSMPQDKRYVAFVREQLEKGHELALHGVTHGCRVIPEEDHELSWKPSVHEYDCADYRARNKTDIPVATQVQWLKEGSSLLSKIFPGQETNILVPPAHAFNSNTLHAMKETGFEFITDYGRWDPAPYLREGVIILPFEFEDYVRNANEDGSNEDATFSMFTKYFDKTISQKGYFAAFLHPDLGVGEHASQARLRLLDNMIKYAKQAKAELTTPNNLGVHIERLQKYQ